MTKKTKASAAATTEAPTASEEVKKSNHVQRKFEERKKGNLSHQYSVSLANICFTDAKIDPLLEQQFNAGRLYASISSRPGQSGRADGYILEGKELEVNRPDCQLNGR